jgi:hypothetical protein
MPAFQDGYSGANCQLVADPKSFTLDLENSTNSSVRLIPTSSSIWRERPWSKKSSTSASPSVADQPNVQPLAR